MTDHFEEDRMLAHAWGVDLDEPMPPSAQPWLASNLSIEQSAQWAAEVQARQASETLLALREAEVKALTRRLSGLEKNYGIATSLLWVASALCLMFVIVISTRVQP